MPEPQQDRTFEFLGMKIPISRWGVYGLSAVVVVLVALWGWRKIYDDPERALLTLKQVNQRILFEVDEYGKHAMEEPTKHELFEDEDGALIIRVYRDHCVLIQRRTRDGMKTKIIPDLARRDLIATNWVATPKAPWGLPVLHAAAAPVCNRGCINPHPGPFRQWFGAQQPNGWVEVWRQWPEGCTHYQMFYPARGIWDSNPDGSPKVRWTCCTH